MRTAGKVLGVAIAALLLVAIGVALGIFYADSRDPIEPVRISQFYGVSDGLNDDGQYCIENDDEGRRCAVPRLRDGEALPPAGALVRGGYGRIPSDTSDLPEPSWIWITELSCLHDTSNEAVRCP